MPKTTSWRDIRRRRPPRILTDADFKPLADQATHVVDVDEFTVPLVCVICGRIGSRGFTIIDLTARPFAVCKDDKACERRSRLGDT